MNFNKKIIFFILSGGLFISSVVFATRIYTDGNTLTGDGTVDNPIKLAKSYSPLSATPNINTITANLAYSQGTYISILSPKQKDREAFLSNIIGMTLKSRNGQMQVFDTTLVMPGDTLFTLELNKSPYLKIVINDSIHTTVNLTIPRNKIYYWDNMIKVGKEIALYSKYNVANAQVKTITDDSITLQMLSVPSDLYRVTTRDNSANDSLRFENSKQKGYIRYTDIDSTNIYSDVHSDSPLRCEECHHIRLDSLRSISFSPILEDIKNNNVPFKINICTDNGDTIPDTSYPWGDNVVYRNSYGSIVVNHPIHGFADSIYNKSTDSWANDWNRYGVQWKKSNHTISVDNSNLFIARMDGKHFTITVTDTKNIKHDLYDDDTPVGIYLDRLLMGIATRSIPNLIKLCFLEKNGKKYKLLWGATPDRVLRVFSANYIDNACNRLFYAESPVYEDTTKNQGLVPTDTIIHGRLNAQGSLFIGNSYDWANHRFKPESKIIEIWNNGDTTMNNFGIIFHTYSWGNDYYKWGNRWMMIGAKLKLVHNGGDRGDAIVENNTYSTHLVGGFVIMRPYRDVYGDSFESWNGSIEGETQDIYYPGAVNARHDDGSEDKNVFWVPRVNVPTISDSYTDALIDGQENSYWCYFQRKDTVGQPESMRIYVNKGYVWNGINTFKPQLTQNMSITHPPHYEYVGHISDILPEEPLPGLNRIWAVDSISEKVEAGMVMLRNYTPITFTAQEHETPKVGDYIITHSHTISKITDKGIATDTTYLLGGISTTPNNVNLNFAQGFTFSNVQGAVTNWSVFNDTILIKDIYGNPKSDYTEPGLVINQNGAIAQYDGQGHFTTISGTTGSNSKVGITIKKDTVIGGHQYLTADKAFFKKLGEEVKFWDTWGREWYWGKNNEVLCSGDNVACFVTLISDYMGRQTGILIPCADNMYVGGEVIYSIPQEYMNAQGMFFVQHIDSIHDLIKGNGKLSFDERLMWRVSTKYNLKEKAKEEGDKILPTLYFSTDNSKINSAGGIEKKSFLRKLLEFILPFLRDK